MKIVGKSYQSLTETEKSLVDTLKHYRRRIQYLQKSKATNVERLREAKRCLKYNNYNLSKLSKKAQSFITSQLSNALRYTTLPNIASGLVYLYLNKNFLYRKPKGVRFSRADMMLAAHLFKSSGKCYRFLRSIFKLSSRSTISKFLQTIEFYPGINPFFFARLKHVGETLNSKEKAYIIMFDEMSIIPKLMYVKNMGYIKGMEEYSKDIGRTTLRATSLYLYCKVIFCFYFKFVEYKILIIISLVSINIESR